jgi:beta-glucosidase-like glycosyl hydrolase
MTPEEKFWQLFMLAGEFSADERRFQDGLFGLQVPADADTAGLRERMNAIQRHFVDETRLGIPIIFFAEALHGLVQTDATIFPQAIGLAASFDTTLMGAVARATAEDCRARGVRQVLSPVVNIATDVRWGRVEETYGEDPYLTTEMGVAFVAAFERNGVITTPKHWIANVGDGGRDSYPIELSERAIREIHLPPFLGCIRRGGARSLMAAYNSLDGSPCTANAWLNDHLLKRELGFSGILISDAGGVGGANVLHFTASDYGDATQKAIGSGLDVIFQTSFDHHILFDPPFREGRIDQARVDDAVARVLQAKFELGLFEDPYLHPGTAPAPDARERGDYVLRLNATIEDGELAKIADNPVADVNASFPKERRDELALSLWPAGDGRLAAANLKVALYDEKGLTRKALEGLGLAVAVDLAKTVDLATANLVVVGRESLSAQFHQQALACKLQEKVESGAVDLLIFEQTPSAAPALAPDLDDLSIRDTFPLDGAHPALAGLKPGDCQSWRGDANIIPGMPEIYFYFKPGAQRFPKWTNENVVCSHVLRKPEYGNFRPLVEADFDLWGAPLLECLAGKGVALFCQMDVTGRDDPAARALLRNLFAYLQSRAAAPKADPFKPVYVLGDGSATEILKRRGVQAKAFDETSAAPGVLVIGAAKESVAAKAGAILKFVQQGGEVLYLVDTPAALAAELAPGVKADKSDAYRFRLVPGNDGTRGLGQGDLVFAAPPGVPVFSGAVKALTEPAALCEVRQGKGRILLAPLLDPDKYAGQWAAAKIERLYSLLLTNLGARQAGPDLNFPTETPQHDPAAGRVSWNFENDMGGWDGGALTEERAYHGRKCAKVSPFSSKGDAVWDRGHLELEADPKQGGILKLGPEPWFRFATFNREAVFLVITVETDKKRLEFEYRTAANAWVPLAMPLANFSGGAGKLEGQVVKRLKIRWGGLADTKREVDMFVDDICIGAGPKSVFQRHPKPPTYDPNVYVTW